MQAGDSTTPPRGVEELGVRCSRARPRTVVPDLQCTVQRKVYSYLAFEDYAMAV